MKSVISDYEMPYEALLELIEIVKSVGIRMAWIESGCVEITELKVEKYKYIITTINDSIVAFELENVYCFKF